MKVNQTDLYLFLLFQRLSQHSRIVPGFDIVETVFFSPPPSLSSSGAKTNGHHTTASISSTAATCLQTSAENRV